MLLVYKALNGYGHHPDLSGHLGSGHGEAAFSSYALCIWNNLPENCRSAETLTSSRRKTFFLPLSFIQSNIDDDLINNLYYTVAFTVLFYPVFIFY